MGLTHLSRLQITPTAGKGDASTDNALLIDSTRTGTALVVQNGGTTKFKITKTGQSTFNGTANFTGGRIQFQRWATISVFTGGGSAIAGRRAIATGGSSVIATKRITGTALLFLTAGVNTGIANVVCYEKRGARVAGTSFKAMLKSATGTVLTGVVNWLIVRTTAAGS